MILLLQSLCLLSLAFVFYVYLGYPLLIWAWARLRPRPVHTGEVNLTCSVIISTYNDGQRLEAKLRQLISMPGNDRMLEILVGSDASTDDTKTRIAGITDARIRFFDFPERRGKPAVLNDLIRVSRGDLLLMMDSRQLLKDDAVERLLSHFSDPEVHVVSGELVFTRSDRDTAAAEGIDAYWRYEKWIRRNEGLAGSVPGATGALYALRRDKAERLPDQLVLDDVALPMLAIAGRGRCVFDSEAILYDTPAQDPRKEGVRKRRTIAGSLQLLHCYPRWVLPWGHPAWFFFLSHKIARLFTPFALGVGWVLSLYFARSEPLFQVLAGGQFVVYVLSVPGLILAGNRKLPRLLSIPTTFVRLQGITLLAWSDALTGRLSVRWDTSGTR